MGSSFRELLYKEGPWAYGLFWAGSVALFTMVVWAPRLVPFAEWTRGWEQTLVIPQGRLILYAAPALVEKWPGPLGNFLTDGHRWMIGIADGLLGWLAARVLFGMFGAWPLRALWLAVSWAIWVGGVSLWGKILAFSIPVV